MPLIGAKTALFSQISSDTPSAEVKSGPC